MPEQNVITDLRAAKNWLDNQSSTVHEHVAKLAAIEQDYLRRTGTFAAIPSQLSEEARRAIENALQEPGQNLLAETRLPRSA